MLSEALRHYYENSPWRGSFLCWYPFRDNAGVLDLSGGVPEEFSDAVFDYVVVADPQDFSVDGLKKLRTRLNPNGRLLLAYENPFALRYWSGKCTSASHWQYDSLFGRDGRVSKAEMQIRLKLAGFAGQKWYYPLTDHWFTREVYSENYLPNEYLNQRFTPT